MSREQNQKMKIICIAQILMEQTDEEHPVTTREILLRLEERGIRAECKSVYSDLETLTHYGMDIICKRGRGGGYYLASRVFELPELKLLVDAVQSSRFITEKKCEQLVEKLGTLASRHQSVQLGRAVYIPNRIRAMNESIYYNIDEIHAAILSDSQICFDYFDFNIYKEKVYRHHGERYCVSPYSLMWSNENYYLIAYDGDAERIKHFRVDKMEKIAVCRQPREGKAAFEALDPASYSSTLFGMFGGERRKLVLLVQDFLAGAMIDRFGYEVKMTDQHNGWFLLESTVELSPQFYGWLMGFGTQIKVVAPEEARTEYSRLLREVLRLYQG